MRFFKRLAFSSPPLLFMEERAGRGGLLNIAFPYGSAIGLG